MNCNLFTGGGFEILWNLPKHDTETWIEKKYWKNCANRLVPSRADIKSSIFKDSVKDINTRYACMWMWSFLLSQNILYTFYVPGILLGFNITLQHAYISSFPNHSQNLMCVQVGPFGLPQVKRMNCVHRHWSLQFLPLPFDCYKAHDEHASQGAQRLCKHLMFF